MNEMLQVCLDDVELLQMLTSVAEFARVVVLQGSCSRPT